MEVSRGTAEILSTLTTFPSWADEVKGGIDFLQQALQSTDTLKTRHVALAINNLVSYSLDCSNLELASSLVISLSPLVENGDSATSRAVIESLQLLCEANPAVRPRLLHIEGLLGVLVSLLKSTDERETETCCSSLLGYTLYQAPRQAGETLDPHDEALLSLFDALAAASQVTEKVNIYLQVLLGCLLRTADPITVIVSHTHASDALLKVLDLTYPRVCFFPLFASPGRNPSKLVPFGSSILRLACLPAIYVPCW